MFEFNVAVAFPIVLVLEKALLLRFFIKFASKSDEGKVITFHEAQRFLAKFYNDEKNAKEQNVVVV